MRVLIVFAIAILSFACGGAPTNNANHPANVSNTSNSSMTNSMPSNSVNASSNAMSNRPANMSTNSATNANSKSNTSTISNSAKSNTSASSTTAGQIKGNKATKVYHLPGCPDYNSISPGNVVTFATEQDARKAGYKIAGNCK